MKTFPFLAAAVLVISLPGSAASAVAPPPVVVLGFDEGSGAVTDNSGMLGAAADGTISGATFSTDSAFATGYSLLFDGDTDFVTLPNSIAYGDKVTVWAWIKPAGLSGQQAIYDDYGSPGVFLALFGDKLEWNISTQSDPGQGVSIFAGRLCPNVWQHIAGTYDGSTIRAYVNGVEVGSKPASGAIIDNGSNPTHLGADSASPNLLEYSGRLDAVQVYLDAVSPADFGYLRICGELTGDCTIGTTDALAALQMAVDLRDVDFAADVDNNETVSTKDALGILRIAVGLEMQTNRCNNL